MKYNIVYLILTLMMTSCHDNSELNTNKSVETKLKENTFDYSKMADTTKTSLELSSNNSISKDNASIHMLKEIDNKEIKKRELIFDKYIKERGKFVEFIKPLYSSYYKYKKDNSSLYKPKSFDEILLESIILNGLGNESNCIRLEKGKVWFVINYKGEINCTILNFKNGKELFSFETKTKKSKVSEFISEQIKVEDSGNYFVYVTNKNKWKMLITEEGKWKSEERIKGLFK